MSSVIITVVVVLGIVVAGGFLLYFMADLFMSLANRNKDQKTIEKRNQEKSQELEERINKLEKADEIKKDPQIASVLYNGAVVEAYDPDEDEDESVIEEPAAADLADDAQESEAEDVDAETEDEDEDDTDISEYIKQRRAELMERLARMQSENTESEDEDDESEQDVVDMTEVDEQADEDDSEVEAEDEPAEDEDAVEAEDDEISDADDADEAADETDENDEDAQGSDANEIVSTKTLEELEASLADAQERLKANEKELRQCKKEFIPLRRVRRTLENDEKKLRRKEALVAKQKVVLYGVNNYSDIDEEKAKKLAEDLDLLDGLKISVQHCQEVMSKNEERYPLLEKIYNLLSSQNAEIKDEIKKLQDAISSLKGEDAE